MTRTGRARRARVAAVCAIALLGVAVLGSLLIGARAVAPSVVWDALFASDPADADHVVIVSQRVPRTVVGLLAGAALAVAGVPHLGPHPTDPRGLEGRRRRDRRRGERRGDLADRADLPVHPPVDDRAARRGHRGGEGLRPGHPDSGPR